MLKRFLSYYKPHKKLFALDMGASLLVALIGIVYPVVTRAMLNDLIPNRKYELIVYAGVCVAGSAAGGYWLGRPFGGGADYGGQFCAGISVF